MSLPTLSELQADLVLDALLQSNADLKRGSKRALLKLIENAILDGRMRHGALARERSSIWTDPAEALPDDETTVIIRTTSTIDPVWFGYRNAGVWTWASGIRIAAHVQVTGWMHLPKA